MMWSVLIAKVMAGYLVVKQDMVVTAQSKIVRELAQYRYKYRSDVNLVEERVKSLTLPEARKLLQALTEKLK